MTDVQQGRSVIPTTAYWQPPPGAWNSPLKFEECDTWSLLDSTIARAITLSTHVKEGSQVPFDELVARVYDKLHVEKPFIEESILRMLRLPPLGPKRLVRRYTFRD